MRRSASLSCTVFALVLPLALSGIARAQVDDPFEQPKTETKEETKIDKKAEEKDSQRKPDAKKADEAKKEDTKKEETKKADAKKADDKKAAAKAPAKAVEKKTVKTEVAPPAPDAPIVDAPADAPADAPPAKTPEKKETKDGDKTDEAKTEETSTAPALPKPDPDVIRLHLGDGSVVAGKLVLDDLLIETEFGRLSVPVAKVRNFTPGLESNPELDKRVNELIEALGGADFKARETAQRALLAMGIAIRAELQRREADGNAERVRRIREILTKLSEMADEPEEGADPTARQAWIRGDTVETDEFTVVGKIVQQSFTMESKYGTLSVRIGDIKAARRELGIVEEQEIRKKLSVEGQYIAQTQFKDSKIRVQRGDKISITADGKIVMSPWGSASVTGPEGSTNYGTGSIGGQSFPGGTLVGRIGNSGKVFKVGTKAAVTADAEGSLMFGVVVHNSYARRGYTFPGNYDLSIRVDRQQAK